MFLSPKHILFDYYILFLLIFYFPNLPLGFPGGIVVKNVPANAGDTGSVPGWGRSSGEGDGNLLQYCYLEIPWTEPGGLQSMWSQRVTQLSD